MDEFLQSLFLAYEVIISLDQAWIDIVLLSLSVSFSALLIASIIGFPIGALLAIYSFRGRAAVLILVDALMSLPPVVVGLLVYLLLSRSGPLGVFNLLYTPGAMIIAQVVLITPIITALTRQIIADLHHEYDELFRSLSLPLNRILIALLLDARISLSTVVLAAFGRAISEVGAVMIVGGNIDHLTRVMTTAIALETSKGNLALALALGIILLLIALMVNIALAVLRNTALRYGYNT